MFWSHRHLAALKHFCKCFATVSLHENVLAAVKILQNIFNDLVLVERYS